MAARVAARLLRVSASRPPARKNIPIPASLSQPSHSRCHLSTPHSCSFAPTASHQTSTALAVNRGESSSRLDLSPSPAASPPLSLHASTLGDSTRRIVRHWAIRSATSPVAARPCETSIYRAATWPRRWMSSDSVGKSDVAFAAAAETGRAAEGISAGSANVDPAGRGAEERTVPGEEAVGAAGEQGEEGEGGDAEWGTYRDRRVGVRNFQGEECGEAVLAGSIFDVPIRRDIVHRVVLWQLAKRRQGTHSTKAVGEVRGSSRKPWKQKGTGRARHGSARGPQFRGGATMHGPKPRSHAFSLNKKVRALGLKAALSARCKEGQLVLYSDLNPGSPKTKDMAQHVAEAFSGSKKVLFVDGSQRADETLLRASANLHYVNVLPVMGLNVYSILQHDTLIMSLPALQALEHRLLAAKGAPQGEELRAAAGAH